MLSNIHYSSMEHLNNSRYYQLAPALPNANGHRQSHLSTSTSSSCSAYFITRIDLNDYTLNTLKQTIDRNVSGPKIKGLKVKLSLPDEGLIIENGLDANQSWMYKTSELLYFWRDPYYSNIIVVVTLNRSKSPTVGPFSCSIFRLRGNDSVQFFLQRAQQFFAQLSFSSGSKTSAKSAIERSMTSDGIRRTTTDQKHSHRKKSDHHSKTKKFPPLTEFIPEKPAQTESIFSLYHPRTYSETTISSDSQKSNPKKVNFDDNDEKMTSVSNQFSNEYVLELVRELKQLRTEIASFKFDSRFTPTRSISTSPLAVDGDKWDQPKTEIDAETQTDSSLVSKDLSNGSLGNNKRKNERLNTNVNKRTLVQNNEIERAEVIRKTSSPPQTNGFSSSNFEEDYQPTSHPSRPGLEAKLYQNGSAYSNSSERKEMDTEPSTPFKAGEVVSFRSSLEDTIPPPENIYENIPIVVPTNSNQGVYYRTSTTKENDQPQLRVTLEGNQKSQLQQQYLSQLFGPDNGISLLFPPQGSERTIPIEEGGDDDELVAINTPPSSQQYFQQVMFSDHLTNPLFNIDKQLLANTIANQFEIDPKSSDLQKLIENQHLFVGHKRTFANMLWKMAPEEENLLCSSPITSAKTVEFKSTDWNNTSSSKPILKQKKSSSRSLTKGQRISWDNTLD